MPGWMLAARSGYLNRYMHPDAGAGGGGGSATPPGGGAGGAGAGGTGGAGGAAPPVQITPEIQTWLDQVVATQVSGLKAKNGELIAEQKNLKENLQRFEGIDPEVVKTILKRFGDDEEAALIKQGKIEEVLTKRTDRMNQDWQKKLDAEIKAREKLEARSNKLADRAAAQAIISAATKAGALPEAMEDIVLRAKGSGWTIDENGDPVALRDGEVVFGKDGKTALSPLEWAEGLRETAPHLWPRAQGSNAPGNSGNAGRAGAIDPKLSPEARLTLARQQGMQTH